MTESPLYDLRLGNALTVLKTLADQSVDCCITSPPYLGLRSYGLPPSLWGGSEACEHVFGEERSVTTGRRDFDTLPVPKGGHKTAAMPQIASTGAFCTSCGAWRGQLGLEPDPDTYVRNLVLVFEEVKRVLSKRGTLWLNIGDSYAGSWGAQGNRETPGEISRNSIRNHPKRASHTGTIRAAGVKPKDLMGMPWRVAFALQAAGWYLRCDCVWSKENPLPESVRDRPSRSHEYVFLLTRSARYWYDAESVQEPVAPDSLRETKSVPRGQQKGNGAGLHHTNGAMASHYEKIGVSPDGRNRRSVWSIPVQPFVGAHFAVMPERLVEPCVKAGCPVGGVVLDPFAGSGTVGVVALQHGRRFLGIEMQEAYLPLIAERLARYEGLGQAPEEAKIQGPRTLSLGI